MELYSFFNSVNGDRKYKADDWARYFSKFITNGVFPNIGSNLQVVTDGNNMTVNLKAGAAWINGYMYENTSDLTINVDVADGVLNRIDRVVIQLNYADRLIRTEIKKGAFASSPVAPSLQRDADIFELGIADITVNKGITSVTQSNITDLRLNTNICGMVNSLLQADTTAIFNQFQDWFNSTKVVSEDEINQFIGQQEQDFNTWFESIKGKLDGDVAAKLSSDLTDLENEVETHKADYVAHPGFGVTVGSNNAYTVTLNPAPTSLVNGMGITFAVHADSTGPATLNVNDLDAKAIKDTYGEDVTELKANSIYTVRYSTVSGNFILQGERGLSLSQKQALADAINAATDKNNTMLDSMKADIADSIGAPTLATDSFGKMASDIDVIKAKLASKVGGNATDSLDSLAEKAVDVNAVVKVKTGQTASTYLGPNGGTLTISGLPFRPSTVVVELPGNGQGCGGTVSQMDGTWKPITSSSNVMVSSVTDNSFTIKNNGSTGTSTGIFYWKAYA